MTTAIGILFGSLLSRKAASAPTAKLRFVDEFELVLLPTADSDPAEGEILKTGTIGECDHFIERSFELKKLGDRLVYRTTGNQVLAG